ncbi:MAG: TRAP transporter large permease subunit, partial [Oceanospirillaceae bacterium]|nr:TRAP transporter large permease subunit [Oceanospirillaceae bacterium]
TGVPVKFGVLLNSVLTDSLMISLLVAAVGCVILGMGMPTLPAYVTVATIAIPAMQMLGLDTLTAHMFVFMIAVGSAITPPVAIAAYAAATISGGAPIRTSVDASRVGIMIFLIPFMFAYNPMMLSVDQENLQFAWIPWFWLIFKLLVSIPVLSSALIGYDKAKLNILEIALRITCVVLMFVPDGYWDLIGLLGAVLILLAHRKVLGFNSLMKEGGAL